MGEMPQLELVIRGMKREQAGFSKTSQTNRISLASFSNLQCHAHDQSCCFSGVVF